MARATPTTNGNGGKKRSSHVEADVDTPSSRRSKRIKTSPLNADSKTVNGVKKSPYFDGATSEESEDDPEESPYGSERSADEAEDDDDEATSESIAASEDEDSDRPTGKKKRPIDTFPTHKTARKSGTDLWRPGIKVDQPAGEAVFIPLPKPRPMGKTAYVDSRIHPNTLLFLGDLRANNDRDWLKMHDTDYRRAKSDWDAYVDVLTEHIVSDADETIPELPHKDLTFRIYRDIRFSPDPTPYKTHFSAAWSRTGRKGPYAGYYVQIKPDGGSFIGAGIWQPEADKLALLRRAIDRRPTGLQEILCGERLTRDFLDGSHDRTTSTKAGGRKSNKAKSGKSFSSQLDVFLGMNAEGALKTKPRDYPKDHPSIAILRLRNYTIGKNLPDEDILASDSVDRIVNLLGTLEPFVTYLNSIVMPDEPSDTEVQSAAEDEVGGSPGQTNSQLDDSDQTERDD